MTGVTAINRACGTAADPVVRPSAPYTAETMAPPAVQPVRVILCIACALYLPLYLFTLFVATVTSGNEILRQPLAWYAALMPVTYVCVVAARAFRVSKKPVHPVVAAALNVVALPALKYSFLGLGLLLPVFAALWWALPASDEARLTAK